MLTRPKILAVLPHVPGLLQPSLLNTAEKRTSQEAVCMDMIEYGYFLCME